MATPPDNVKTRKPKKSQPSRKKAIEDMCKMCSYDKLSSGTWREQVRDCASANSCPLYPVRPLPTTKEIPVNEVSDE
ncbi:hypothetical protein NVP3058O_076 [Vibrio phage 3.058.O._10N.286.46.B8]|nr:hypothetical protein NVP2058O_077 [Vibrio phage 2.058.O._10N.286.46.B8]AUS03146.1 hypothetical protein NVP3058O_076 [Vibrio phage 3.058.O._10N.286.46.B8]